MGSMLLEFKKAEGSAVASVEACITTCSLLLLTSSEATEFNAGWPVGHAFESFSGVQCSLR